MKIVLIPCPTIVDKLPNTHLPLGLLSVATILHNDGFDVEIFDINNAASDSAYRNIPSAIMARKPDVIGFSTMCNQYPAIIRLAQCCRKINPEVFIILGGPQATITDQDTLEAFPFIDAIIRGESEQVITKVIYGLSSDTARKGLAAVPSLTFREGKKVIRTPSIIPVSNLDDLPLPDYSLFPTIKKLDKIPIEVGRGCPFGCIFCSAKDFWNKTFRLRSIESLIKLIKRLVHNYDVDKFDFLHDILTLSKDRTVEFCNALKQEKLDIEWFCSSRIDCLDAELLTHMRNAGCSEIFFGVETGSPRMQKVIGKNIKLNYANKTIKQISKLGISFTASFITGFPEERLNDLEETISSMIDLRFAGDIAGSFQLHIVAPLQGTFLHEKHGRNLLFDNRFSDIAHGKLINDDLKLVKKYPNIFSVFYYYPTRYLSRDAFLRVRYLMLNLLFSLPYTTFVLWKDKKLGFPRNIFRYLSLLKLPGNHKKQIGNIENLKQIERFLRSVLYQSGFKNHFIYDVMKYELATNKVALDNEEKIPGQIEKFVHDVEKLIEDISDNTFQKLPPIVEKNEHVIVFTKKNKKCFTVKLDGKIESLLS